MAVSIINVKQAIPYAMAVLLVVSITTGSVTAQEATDPSVTLANADITVNVGDQRQVNATYQFDVAKPGSGEKRLTKISGKLWKFPNRQIKDISANVNGQAVDASVSRHGRYIDVVVPVNSVSAGETVTVTMTYTVSEPTGTVKTPIWVPSYQTSGSARVIDMMVTLPDGSQPQGAEFPTYDTKSGNTLQYKLLHVPGFVYLEYGTGGGSLLPLDTLLSLIGIAFIIVFFGVWLRFIRRQTGGDHVA